MNQPANQTRRDFLKQSAGVVAATAATASLLRAPAAYGAAADDTIKIALIGAGGRGTGAAAQALSTAGPTKLVAIADAFENNVKDALENLKNHGDVADKVDVGDRLFHGFDAYQKAIDSGADVIILATPPGFRPIHFEAAVKAGKHVFMEKPVAVDATGVRKVLEAAKVAKEKNLKVGVGLQRHHDPKYQETVKRLQDGAIGDTVLLRVYWNGGGVWVRGRQPGQTEMEYQMRNWYYFNWLCGDHINEQHIHNIDVGNWVKNGPPAVAQGQGGRQVRTGIDHGEIYDHHMVEFTYPDGTKMLSQCRHIPNTPDLVDEFGHGTKGEAHIGGGSIRTRDGSEWRYQGRGGDPYQIEHDVLFDAIRNNKAHNEAEYGATSTMTAIMGRMATYSGQVIYWDKATAQKAGKADAPVALESSQNLMPERLAWDAKPPTLPGPDGRYPIAMPGSTKVA
jgi:myo-inositol 2-dehydrogenase/D-chiro-inositol 1-dehydrogenase